MINRKEEHDVRNNSSSGTDAGGEEQWGGLGRKIGERVGKYGVYYGDRGVYDTRNTLNDLTGKEWIQFTKSWFVHNPPARKEDEILHPAKFPETLVADFIRFFTKEGNVVLDPMLGTGSTLVACDMTRRKGVGVELINKWADIARKRTKQTVIEGDARELKNLLRQANIRNVDFCITSPPYWNMLRQTRGHVRTAAHVRRELGLDEYYSDDERDLGNIKRYDDYIESLFHIYAQVYDVLRDGGYMVIIIQNILTPEGEMVPLAWDLAKRLSKLFVLKQERLWLQNNKTLGTWGYPFKYVSSVHHHYCLVFQKDLSFKKLCNHKGRVLGLNKTPFSDSSNSLLGS
jgi:DNA modification methylase